MTYNENDEVKRLIALETQHKGIIDDLINHHVRECENRNECGCNLWAAVRAWAEINE